MMFKQHISSGCLLLLFAAVAIPISSRTEDAFNKPIHKATTLAPVVKANVEAHHAAPIAVGAVPTAAAAAVTHSDLKGTLAPATVGAKVAVLPTVAATVHVNGAKVTPAPVVPAVPAHLTTVAPVGGIKVVPNVKSATTISPHELAAAKSMSIDEKLEQYFLPICDSVDKLKPKQFFKIQSELKQFVAKTAGKMSVCFMKQFGVDPNLTPVTNAQLSSICASRKSVDAKGSFKLFKECANHNWDVNLDKELERIIAARLNCAKNHNHSKNDTSISLAHDNNNSLADDESSFISEVVNKVFDEAKAVVSKSDVQVIDVGAPTHSTIKPSSNVAAVVSVAPAVPKVVVATTIAPVVAVVPTHAAVVVTTKHPEPSSQKPIVSTGAPAPIENLASNKKLLNDPNTVVVFVDNSNSKRTTIAPVVKSHAEASSKPVVVVANKTEHAATATTVVPVVLATSAAPAATTAKPVVVKVEPTVASVVKATLGEHKAAEHKAAEHKAASTAAPTPASSAAAITTSAPAAKVADHTSTAPTVAIKITTGHPVVDAATSAAPAVVSTTSKPAAATVQSVVAAAVSSTKKPELAVASVSSKPEAASTTTSKPEAVAPATPTAGSLAALISSTTTLAPKGTDKPDAKSVKGSQKPGRASDARLHQLEHERQMSIDPIGHTIKHQQYEAAKQEKSKANSSKKD